MAHWAIQFARSSCIRLSLLNLDSLCKVVLLQGLVLLLHMALSAMLRMEQVTTISLKACDTAEVCREAIIATIS